MTRTVKRLHINLVNCEILKKVMQIYPHHHLFLHLRLLSSPGRLFIALVSQAVSDPVSLLAIQTASYLVRSIVSQGSLQNYNKVNLRNQSQPLLGFFSSSKNLGSTQSFRPFWPLISWSKIEIVQQLRYLVSTLVSQLIQQLLHQSNSYLVKQLLSQIVTQSNSFLV